MTRRLWEKQITWTAGSETRDATSTVGTRYRLHSITYSTMGSAVNTRLRGLREAKTYHVTSTVGEVAFCALWKPGIDDRLLVVQLWEIQAALGHVNCRKTIEMITRL